MNAASITNPLLATAVAATTCTAAANLAPAATYTHTSAKLHTWGSATGSIGSHSYSSRSRYWPGEVTPQSRAFERFADVAIWADRIGVERDEWSPFALYPTSSTFTYHNWRGISGNLRQTFRSITYGENPESTVARSTQDLSFDLSSVTRVSLNTRTLVTFPESVLERTAFHITLFDDSDTPVLALTLTGTDLVGRKRKVNTRLIQEVPAGSYRLEISHFTRLESTYAVDEPLDVLQRAHLDWSLRFKRPSGSQIQQLRAIPAPGSLGLVASLGLLAARRRR